MQLVELCCQRLSTLLPLIDSLEGIPEHLGQTVFALIGSEYTRANFNCQSDSTFKIFEQAYGHSFIRALRLHTHFIHLLSMLTLSVYLQYLYLDSCELGSKYARFLPVIGQMKQLTVLSLRHNSLCRDHVRTLTASSRFSRSSNLQCLDLSGNGYLGENCLSFALQLTSLRELHCSDTGIAISPTPRLPSNWSSVRKHLCSFSNSVESGWFSRMVLQKRTASPIEEHFEDSLTLCRDS
ncbi:unnamed protein product [Dicrocoelium dendriticum]|nr:unnamed protein product [Dicrocoelium dendriticum]